MSLKEALLIALRAVRAHRLRSTLTMLGLIIGVSAVVLLAACGQGVKNSVDARSEPVANNITIVPKSANVPGAPPAEPLTETDATALQGAPDIATITPAVAGSTGSTTIQTNTSASASAAPAANSIKSPRKPFDRLTSPQPWQRSPESSTLATTSLTPECGTSKFNPKDPDCKASTRS